MLLHGKTAIVYGAAGSVGGAVARAYAREGARVFLAGRTKESLEVVAKEIPTAEVVPVDVLDAAAVAEHAEGVARAAGGIDIAFNATGNDDVQGTPLVDLGFDDFLRPVVKAVTAHFNIGTAVGRHMAERGRGVSLAMAGGREAIASLGGSHVAWSALAGLCRQLASELGPRGVRVAWVLSPGSPGSADAGAEPGAPSLLGHVPGYDTVGNVATFLASDWAATMTATELNITGGAVVD